MARRFLAYLGVLTIVGTGLFLASGAFETSVGAQPATSNKTTVAKTPWGDPDLQGIWSPGYYLTPLQRPNKYSGREFLTDEENLGLWRKLADLPSSLDTIQLRKADIQQNQVRPKFLCLLNR